MNDNNSYFKELTEKITVKDVFNKLGYRIVRAGNSDKVLCPFHNDTNPSLVLYSDHYHCYVCGAHGNIFEIIKHEKNYSFYEALNWVEEEFPQYKRNIRQSGRLKKAIKETGFDIALNTYRKMESNEQDGLSNFANERNFNSIFLQKAEIYYAVKDKLCDKHQDDIINRNLLLDNYLIKRKVKVVESDIEKYIDIFSNNRIVLTLRNLKDEIMGFVGRAITKEDKPKYLFTKNLKKSRMLYRLNSVRKNNLDRIEKEDQKENTLEDVKSIELYIVEGAFDALRLESLGYNAAAVLGSHITKSQVDILIDYIKDVSKDYDVVKLHLFLDSDKAGLKGAYQSIKNLWQTEYTRSIYIDVIVNKSTIQKSENSDENGSLASTKDPDDILIYKTRQEADIWLKSNTISTFEFLLRYFSDVEELNFEHDCFEIYYTNLDLNQKISLFNKVVSMIPNKYWKQIIAFYSSLRMENEDFSFGIVQNYIISAVIEKSSKSKDRNDVESKSVNQLMNHALQVAQKSYKADDLPIDSFTWDRIQQCADAFYPFFHKSFKMKETVKAPMLAINTPKKSEEYRLRTLFSHENLILQQYLLNELLRTDENRDYEKFIPAIRYNPNLKDSVYTTGLDYYNHFEEMTEKAVSFAYQVNMTAINGETLGGMFRPYYESWKSFIQYLEDGIKKLDSDKIFKVRLDIRRFYDGIPMRGIRRVLIEPLKQALGLSDRFNEIFNDESNDDRAKSICDWLLDEVFHYEYVDPETGETKRYNSALKGIPQGSNLSAYLSNIALFPLDKAVSKYVNKINNRKSKESNDGKLAIRYARYVDDMVIISTNSDYLNDIKDIIIDELSEVELSLSNKTDDADMVDKEEAFEWLIDERGGLGASGISDAPEESTEDIITDYQSFETIDRREALKVLQNMVYDFPEDNREDFTEIFFRTQEVRYTDIKRFATFLLRHIIRGKDPRIIYQYKKIWEKYRPNAPMGSMIRRKEVEHLALIDAMLGILSDNISLKLSSMERNNRRDDKKAIIDIVTHEDFIKIIKEINSAVELKGNHYILKLKWLAIFNHVLKNINTDEDKIYEEAKRNFEITCLPYIFNKNMNWSKITIYEKRFLFSIHKEAIASKIETNLLDFYTPNNSTNSSSLDLFHLVTSYIIAIKGNKTRFFEMKELLSEKKPILSDDIFTNCIYLWFNYDKLQIDDLEYEYVLRVGVNILLNILHSSIKAEVIESNSILKNHLFKVSKRDELNYLPVPPGVDYPGIFSLNGKKPQIQRVDFGRNDYDCTINLEWTTLNNCNNNIWGLYKAATSGHWKNINDYLYNENDNKEKTGKFLKEVARIYRSLKDKLDIEGMKPIISKYHIFITEKKEIEILSYKLEYSKLNSSVAISNGSNSLKVVDVPHVGSVYWQIAYVLDDALRTDRYIYSSGSNNENTQAEKMLSYSFKRLKGDWMNRSSIIKNVKSYEKTVERTLQSLEKFAEAEDKQLYTLDCIVINRFISFRMNNSIDKPGEVEYFLGAWAKSVINHEFNELLEVFSDDYTGDSFIREDAPLRRVSLSYLLVAKRLSSFINEGNAIGLKALRSGLFIHSVTINLKMQVFERIISLKKEEYENLLKKDFPSEFLQIDITEVCIVKVQKDEKDEIVELKDIVKNLCKKQIDNRINQITPIGWLLLLCWVLEIYEQINYVTSAGIKRKAEKEKEVDELKHELPKLANSLILIDSYEVKDDNDVTKYKNSAFPFDNVNMFIHAWNGDKISQVYQLLNKIDKLDDIKVEKQVSKYFNYTRISKNTIEINLPNKGFHSLPSFFLTDGVIGNNGKRKEVDNLTRSIWSETTVNNEIIGISVISKKLMKLSAINNYESMNDHYLYNEKDTNSMAEGEKITHNVVQSKETKIGTINRSIQKEKQENIWCENKTKKSTIPCYGDEKNIKNRDLKDKNIASNNKSAISHKICQFKDVIREINKLQNDNWKDRKKHFSSYDRIAFFQFNVDNSYEHPIIEMCNNQSTMSDEEVAKYKKVKSEWNPNKLKQKRELGEGISDFSSCAEFRRQKLLEKILEVCKNFGVEILILPEYSVRPESVEWLSEEIAKRGYKISIWAGTLRLVPNRNLNINVFDKKLTSKDYDWAALLPIVTYNTHKFYNNFNLNQNARSIEPSVIVDRIKKYPAVSLQEVFNPSRARNKSMKFDAVIKEKFNERLFGDARDHVFELICAELFMIASPSNISVMAKVSFDLYKRFSRDHSIKFKDYYEEVIEDIIKFGERTGVHQKEFKYARTPILLVPAYTTRAVDYYVTAQAGYLASGLTTVFCNAVGEDSVGGSCFIGTDSWDNRNGNKGDLLPNYSLYHGVTPGIYQQFLQHKDRGALAEKEQALVICDINPNISFKGKPNPQTLGAALELVAHLPIIESHVVNDKMKDKLGYNYKYYCRCHTYIHRKVKHQNCLECQDFNVCNLRDDVWEGITELYEYFKDKENDYKTTTDDEKPDIIGKALKSIGKGIKSDWLSRRGEAYIRQHVNNPQPWPPPTALDWIWIDVDYQNEYDINKTKIDIPKF